MTKRFVKENGITLQRLIALAPGEGLGSFECGYLVNPEVCEGLPNCGYPEARVDIRAYSREDNPAFGTDHYTRAQRERDLELEAESRMMMKFSFGSNYRSSEGPVTYGESVKDTLAKLFSDRVSVRGEINNKSKQ